MASFAELGVPEPLLQTIVELGFEEPTPIQEQAIPELLAGHDVIGQAQTGTGKTAAFGLPLLAYLDPASSETQAVVLTPTRELCIQVTQALRSYAEHMEVEVLAVFGGQAVATQASRLRGGAQVVVATVGRMLDLLTRGSLVLTSARYVVLDEADEMLDLGFIEDVERILRICPSGRQTSLFSATIPPPVERLAEKYMYDPVTIRVTPRQLTVDAIEQAYVEVPGREKVDRLVEVVRAEGAGRAITFVTPAQLRDLERIERDVRIRIGAWEPPDERLEHAPRPRRREHAVARHPHLHGDRAHAEPADEHVKLFVNRGRQSGIDPDSIRWALVEGAVIPVEAIGAIRVLERFSFVDLDAGHAEQALERLDGTRLEGRQIRVEYARG